MEFNYTTSESHSFRELDDINGCVLIIAYLIPQRTLFKIYYPSGKDRIIFVTKEDHEAPSNAELIADDPNDPYEEQGVYN